MIFGYGTEISFTESVMRPYAWLHSVISLQIRSYSNRIQMQTVYFATLMFRRCAFNSQIQVYSSCWQQKRNSLPIGFASIERWLLSISFSLVKLYLCLAIISSMIFDVVHRLLFLSFKSNFCWLSANNSALEFVSYLFWTSHRRSHA